METRGLAANLPHPMKVFREIAEALNEAADLAEAMHLILPKLSAALGLKTAWAFRYDTDRQGFVEVAASGLPPALSCQDAHALKHGWCECQDEFVHGELQTAVNLVRCSRLRDAVGDTEDLRFHASIPLRSKDQALGILNVAASGRTVFTEEALTFLQTVGQQVAVAVHRAGILHTERRRSTALRQLSDVATALLPVQSSAQLWQHACEQFVATFGYAVCGIVSQTVTADGNTAYDIQAVAESAQTAAEVLYVYDTVAKSIQVGTSAQESTSSDDGPNVHQQTGAHRVQSILLAEAASQLMVPIPNSTFFVRVESPAVGAFDNVDEEVIQAFAWHLTAAFESAQLHEQAVHHAHWHERRRLAADLHDAVSQRLFSAQLLATASLGQLADVDVTKSYIERLQTQITASQTEMRSLIAMLQPQSERTLLAGMRDRVGNLQHLTPVRVHLVLPESLAQEPTFAVREALLTITGEAILNAFKHAAAQHLTVTLVEDADNQQLDLTIHDDGCGFDEQLMMAGLGTTTMFDRARTAHGQLRIVTAPGSGTTILCTMPWDPRDPEEAGNDA